MAVSMSAKMMGKVFGLDVGPGMKLLLVAFADHADDDGDHCWPSVGYLAWKTSLSERQVRRMIKQLRDEGVLIPVEREGGGFRRSVVYQLDLRPLATKEPFRREREGISPLDEARKKKARNNQKPHSSGKHDTMSSLAGEEATTRHPV